MGHDFSCGNMIIRHDFVDNRTDINQSFPTFLLIIIIIIIFYQKALKKFMLPVVFEGHRRKSDIVIIGLVSTSRVRGLFHLSGLRTQPKLGRFFS